MKAVICMRSIHMGILSEKAIQEIFDAKIKQCAISTLLCTQAT